MGALHVQNTSISEQRGLMGTSGKLRMMLTPASPHTRVLLRDLVRCRKGYGELHIVHHGLSQAGKCQWLDERWVGTHLTQPQQCHVPSGAAAGQWLPSSFSAAGKNENKVSYDAFLHLFLLPTQSHSSSHIWSPNQLHLCLA